MDSSARLRYVHQHHDVCETRLLEQNNRQLLSTIIINNNVNARASDNDSDWREHPRATVRDEKVGGTNNS